MATLRMFIGLPASGKSTKSRQMELVNGTVVLSSDAIREELLQDINDQSDNDKVFAELYRRAELHLKIGIDVVLDATNISSKTRKGVIDRFRKKADKLVAHYFNTSFDTCLKRNLKRDRTIPQHVIYRMYKTLQIPTYSEGWDEIIFHNEEYNKDVFGMYDLKLDEREAFISTPQSYSNLMGGNLILPNETFYNIYDLPQDSSYHSLSVSRHTYYVWKYILDNYHGEDKLAMLWAGLYHDTGKAFCKTFKVLDDGELSRYANFIGHENVSAQLVANDLIQYYPLDFVLYVVEIVENHMRLLSIGDSDKGRKKLLKAVGQDMFERLEFFREADTNAK